MRNMAVRIGPNPSRLVRYLRIGRIFHANARSLELVLTRSPLATALIGRTIRASFAKLRQRNGIYLAFALVARGLMAVGMFLAIRRFAASSFGEMAFLQATAVSAVAFSSFGIELSINSQLSRNQREGIDRGPTIAAGCIVAFGGILVTCLIVGFFFSSQINVSGETTQATVAICTFASLMIVASLLNSIAFAL